MKRERYYYCGADFETTTPDWTTELNDNVNKTSEIRNWFKNHPERIPQVYSWAVCFDIRYKPKIIIPKNVNIGIKETNENIFFYGYKVNDFLSLFDIQIRPWNIFFHNLKGFDGHFMLPALYNHGATEYPRDESYHDEIRQHELDDFYKKKTSWRKALPYEYRPMIERNQKIYKIDYWIPNFDKKSTAKIRCHHIKDSLLMFNTSIKEMGNQLIKYHVDKQIMTKTEAEDKFAKGSIEYLKTEAYQSLHELETDKNGNELEYLLRDTFILQQFIHLNSIILYQYMPIDQWGLTQGATAIKSWKEELGKDLFNKNLPFIQVRKYAKGLTKYRFGRTGYFKTEKKVYDDLIDNLLPLDWLKQGDTFQDVYRYYKGGMTLINEQYRGKMVKDIYVGDIVSSYPTIMYSDYLCPIGAPVSEAEGQLHLYQVRIKNDLVNYTGLPFMSKYLFDDEIDEVDGIAKHEYKAHLNAGEIYFLDTYSLECFKKYYQPQPTDYEAIVKFSFKAITFKELFGIYIDKWYPLKSMSKKDKNEFLKNFTKVMLNSIYGKFATKILHERNFWNGETKEFEKVTEKTDFIMYLPIALFITSLARVKLIEAVGHDIDGFVYCDTDSIFIKKWLLDKIIKEKRIVIGNELGNWEIENHHPYQMLGRRAKQYLAICQIGGRHCQNCEQRGEKAIKIAYAGINFLRENLATDFNETSEYQTYLQFKDTITFDDFINGKAIDNQLQPMKVLGSGVIIYEMIKHIKPIWEYKPLSEQKYHSQAIFLKNYQETTLHPL